MSSDSQLWFLLGEDINSQSFCQVKLTLEDVKKDGISLSSVAALLALPDPVEEYAFFIHSVSMQASVQMLNDRAVAATWQLYCQNDPIVTIVVRKANDPSPNTSRAPSYSKALGERRTASGRFIVPDLPIHTPPRQVSSGIDSYTQQALADLPETDKIIIVDDHGDAQELSKEYLTSWIASQIDDGKPLTDIVVQTMGVNGKPMSIRLTRELWERSLIRGAWQAEFRHLWANHIDATAQRELMLAKVRDSKPDFTQSCVDFIRDLRTFTGNRGSRARLDATGHEFFLGLPYFDSETRDIILELKTNGSTLANDLRALAQKRFGAEICAAHDLAPLFERVMGISWDKEREKALSKQHSMSRVEITAQGSNLKKLQNKGSKFFKDTFGRKKGGRRGGKGGSSSSGGRASMA